MGSIESVPDPILAPELSKKHRPQMIARLGVMGRASMDTEKILGTWLFEMGTLRSNDRAIVPERFSGAASRVAVTTVPSPSD